MLANSTLFPPLSLPKKRIRPKLSSSAGVELFLYISKNGRLKVLELVCAISTPLVKSERFETPPLLTSVPLSGTSKTSLPPHAVQFGVNISLRILPYSLFVPETNSSPENVILPKTSFCAGEALFL